MKTKLQILIFLMMIFPLSIFSQWESVTGNNLPQQIAVGWAIDAVPNCVVASLTAYDSEFNLFISTDNGNNWNPITLPNDEFAIDIEIVDPLKYLIVTSTGKVLLTVNGGENWTVQFSDSQLTEFMNYIEMFDENNGVAMGDAPPNSDIALIVRTDDGGITWNVMENNNPIFTCFNVWKSIDFVSPDIGFFHENWADRENQGVSKTTDGGDNWIRIHPPVRSGVIKFFDESHGIFITGKGNGKRTFDGGESWENIPFNFIENPLAQTSILVNDIEYVGNSHNNVWAVFRDIVYYSSDFGDTWQKYSFKGDIHFDDMEFTDENTGWLLTRSGIFYTNNNGTMITSVEETEIPKTFKLYQNYPNPFNPTTKICYQIPTSSNVKITVYDLLGNEVAELVNENKNAGYHEVDFNANKLSSGVYFYRLKMGNFIQSKKMILLR